VLLLSDSIGRGLKPEFLSAKASVKKEMVYTIEEAQNYVESSNEPYSKVVIQLLTNDINEESESPENVKDKLSNLVDYVHGESPDTQIYVSQCLPRKDSVEVNRNINKLNALLYDINGVHIITHDNFRQ